ncbi:MAG: hypothetical protein M0R03_17455 [Novosphingobium sp.]|nr:hypothetical protein [Novosphingobium sp.]
MIKYKFNKRANASQQEEVEKYLLDEEFMRVLRLTKSYYIQGFHGDYGFILEMKGGHHYITITIY